MAKVWTWLRQRRKAIVAGVALGVNVGLMLAAPDSSTAHYLGVAVGVLGLLGVHAVPNEQIPPDTAGGAVS